MPETPNQPYPKERRLVTVLFADVQGFTRLADQLDVEEVSDLMRAVWQLVDHVIDTHGGYIDKHIGDAVMAVWGAPQGREDDAERAVSAALKLQDSFNQFTQQSPNPNVQQLKLRVGVNTGQVLAGYVGARGEYTVMGDTVNIASRLETTAQPGHVVVGENTYRLVRGLFRMRRQTALQIKGKAKSISVYWVEGQFEDPTQMRYRSLGGLETRLVGREVELTRLASLYQRTFAGQAPLLAIVRGEAGLGKSRLMMEFTSQLEVSVTNLQIFSSRSLEQAARAPYFVWKQLWYQRFGINENDDPETARDKFLRGVQSIWGYRLGAVSAVEASHLVGALIGLEWPTSPYLARLDTATRVQRAFETTHEIFRRACANGPTLLVLDDLHNADNASLDLLEYLVQPVDQMPLLILGATRPGVLRKRHELHSAAHLVSLKPLAVDAQLVAEAYPSIANLPAVMLTEIARVAEGNPYFMEEMVRSLMQASAQGITNIPEQSTETGYYKLPDSLYTTLQARLDSLPPAARAVALVASVVGRVFWVGAIVAATRQPLGTGVLGGPNVAGLSPDQIADGLAHLATACSP